MEIETLPDLSMPGLDFNESTHIYLLNGEPIPSVTTLMKPLSDSFYKGIPEKVLDRAADKGSAVHNAIENWLKFEIIDIPDEHKGYFDAFMDWWNVRKPVLIGSELRLFHKLMRYGGTGDLACIIDGKRNVVDYKTTYTLSEMMLRVQLEGYGQALASHGFVVEEKRGLQLKKDGTWKEEIFKANDSIAWRTFGALKTVYDYTQSYKK